MADATHPSEETLRRFAHVEATRRENREVVAHFLRGCRACSTFVSSSLKPDAAEIDSLDLAAGGSPSSPSARLLAPRRVS